MNNYKTNETQEVTSELLREEAFKFLNVDEKSIWNSLNHEGKEKMARRAEKRYERDKVLKKWSNDKEKACALYVKILAESAGTKGEQREEMIAKLNVAREEWHSLKSSKPRFF